MLVERAGEGLNAAVADANGPVNQSDSAKTGEPDAARLRGMQESSGLAAVMVLRTAGSATAALRRCLSGHRAAG